MPFVFTTTNTLEEVIEVAWGEETRKAILQLAADLYLSPTNGGDGQGVLAYPLQKGLPVMDGFVESAGPTGVAVEFPEGLSFDDVDDYGIEAQFQENTDGTGGDIYFTKASDGVTIHNSGSGTGYKIFYRIHQRLTT